MHQTPNPSMCWARQHQSRLHTARPPPTKDTTCASTRLSSVQVLPGRWIRTVPDRAGDAGAAGSRMSCAPATPQQRMSKALSEHFLRNVVARLRAEYGEVCISLERVRWNCARAVERWVVEAFVVRASRAIYSSLSIFRVFFFLRERERERE